MTFARNYSRLPHLSCKTRQSQECNIKPLDLSVGDVPGSSQGSCTNRPTTRQPTRNRQQPVPQTNTLCRLPFTTCACSWQYKNCLDLYSKTLVLNQVKYILYSTCSLPTIPLSPSLRSFNIPFALRSYNPYTDPFHLPFLVCPIIS